MDEETELEETKPEVKSPYLIPGSILVAGVIVALAIMYGGGGSRGTAGAPSLEADGQTAAANASGKAQALLEAREGDRVLGNPNATVTFVEFSDFQCPFCGRFFDTTLKQIKEKYVKTGKVKFVYRDFAFLGEESFKAAEAARCAGEQGGFWQYHDTLFESQRGENQGAFSVSNLKRFAADLGLDTTTFDACLDSGKYRSAAEEETRYGQELGVTGTPSSFINGKHVTGALPFSAFETIILEALGE